MKWTYISVVTLVMISCKKDTQIVPLIGKWKMVEMYGGIPQGCFCWGQVSPMYADILDFAVTGKYKIKRPRISSYYACPGRYKLINDSTIVLTSECAGSNPDPVAIGIYSQSTKRLTIEYNYPNGIIKYRYIKL